MTNPPDAVPSPTAPAAPSAALTEAARTALRRLVGRDDADFRDGQLEAISALVKDRAVLMHYRSATGAELDLVVEFADGGRWAIEIKRGEQARPSKAFHAACDTVGATRRLVVNASDRHETIAAGVEMCGLRALLAELAGAA